MMSPPYPIGGPSRNLQRPDQRGVGSMNWRRGDLGRVPIPGWWDRRTTVLTSSEPRSSFAVASVPFPLIRRLTSRHVGASVPFSCWHDAIFNKRRCAGQREPPSPALRVPDAALAGTDNAPLTSQNETHQAVGVAGLVSGKRGRPGNHQLSDGVARRVLAIIRERYADF
jgi:hypothetical protein